MARVLTVLVLGALCALESRPAQAQDGGEQAGDVEQARALFEEGLRALDAGDPMRASAILSRSLELAPRASTAFNLAVAYRRTDRPVDASRLARALARGEYGPLEEARRAQVELLLEATRSAVAELVVSVSGVATAAVSIDGEPAGHTQGDAPLRVLVAPGSRIVEATAPGRAPARVTIHADPGAARQAHIVLGGAPAVRGSMLPGERIVGERPRHASAVGDEDDGGAGIWPWVGAGAALALAAAAVLVIVLASPRAESDPVFGDTATLGP